MPRAVHRNRGRLYGAQYGAPGLESRLHTCGSCLNSAGERRSGTFADTVRVDMLLLLDRIAELSGRAAANMTLGWYV